MRKIELMHYYFGKGEGQCKDCTHLQTGRYHDKILRKCDVYGMTHSEASDWVLKYPACGIKNKPWTGNDMIRMVTPDKCKPKGMGEPMEGQEALF